jgi:L-ascorbate metabolism protein UlaG (beta-lactamase superfamily)
MELGFETIGNATLICHDCRPVLVTDPWIKGSAYFGSWALSHQIPDEQMHSIEECEFVWISHGHPDHLSAESALHKKSGQKSDPQVNKDFLVSFWLSFETRKLHFGHKKHRHGTLFVQSPPSP